MKSQRFGPLWRTLALTLVAARLAVSLSWAADAAPDAAPDATIVEVKNKVDWLRYRENQPRVRSHAGTNLALVVHDQVQTFEDSKAVISARAGNLIELGELSLLEIAPPQRDSSLLLNLWQGALYFFSREKSRSIQIGTRHGTGAHEGTEFLMIVEEDRTLMAVFDGRATLQTDVGEPLVLTNREVGEARTGQPPKKSALKIESLVQWWLYYPGVLDAEELEFTLEERRQLNASLDAYRAGDLNAALSAYPGYPAPAPPATDASRVYLAGLYLAAGRTDKAQARLDAVEDKRLSVAAALRWVMSAVQGKVDRPPQVHTSASEWLGLSYYFQARHELDNALMAARQAVTNSPNFGFGWERVAELEFGFGRVREAEEALQKSLRLAPRNAQAHALHGFLRSAAGRMTEARSAFDEAIQLDSALGNAWLGRGLVRIHNGDAAGGRMDLQTAAILEPDRSLLHSYLGKAFADAGEGGKAALEFDRARERDPKDPTPWLYSALLKREENRVNEAVGDLEESIRLNDNRAVYRPQILLDEDRAVRSSSLANLYQTAGMPEVSLREAALAVSYDYANYSAHQFLADSFNALRDPTRFNLREETVWFNELLLANLLSPVGGTPLSQHLSQQEYSRLFQRDQVGLSSSSEYRSDGQFRELTSQFGTIGNTGWSLDLDYQHNDGVRRNNDLNRIEWYSTFKQQITPQDSVLLLTKYQDYHSGDNFQYYNPTNARPNFTFDETQSPIAVLGYHHEWQPGVHTLVLAGRLENDQRFSDLAAPQALLFRDDQGDPSAPARNAGSVGLDVRHRSQLEIYTAEAQQIFENERHALLLGGRWQGGQFDTHSVMLNPTVFPASFPPQAANVHAVDGFERVTAYAYETLKLPGRLQLTTGLTYEHMRYPENFRAPPIQSGEATRERLNPKAALVWEPLPEATVRAVWARTLGGVSLDESYQLEPTQLGGFVQSFRTLIPESLVGSVSAPDHEILGAALDLKFSSRTYVGFQIEHLRSEVSQTVGVFDFFLSNQQARPSSTRERLNYDETAASVTFNQLLSAHWALGAQYSFVRSDLDTIFPSPTLDSVRNNFDSTTHADLHQMKLSLQYNHPRGFFAEARSEWYFQRRSRGAFSPGAAAGDLPGETMQQLNLFAGYRFSRQRGEITLGVLNATGEDYRLNPVTPVQELPRKAVFYTRLRFRF